MSARRASLRITAAAALALAGLVLGALGGACGRERYVDPHVSCDSGSCICVGGFESCDGDDDNGCETDLQSDLANCGSCGNACPNGASCSLGACVCPGGGAPCGGSCVDTQTDADNCGVCGHGCAGGECVAGICQPVTIDGLDGATSLAVDGGEVYVTRCGSDPAAAAVLQTSTSGGAVTDIGMATGCASLVAATSTSVFWTSAQIVYTASLDLPADAAPIGMGTIPAYYLAAGPSHLYWYSDAPMAPAIVRVQLDTMTTDALPVKTPSGFTVDAAGVYWGDADGIHLWASTSAALVTDINPLAVRALAVQSDVIFAATASGGIQSLPVAPGGAVFAIVPTAAALSIAADESHVYWAEKSDGSVRRANRDGTEITALVQGEAFGAEVPFALDDEAVYWLAGGAVRKVAK